MQIYWLGQACFRIVLAKNKQEGVEIVLDPFKEEIGLKLPYLEADILLVSHDHYDHNNIAKVGGNPFLIEEPGEYEIKNVFVQALSSIDDKALEAKRSKNLIFTFEAENLRLCHLGNLSQKCLTDEQLEKIGSVDILMIPIGGTYPSTSGREANRIGTIDGHEAQVIIAQLEPALVIPMCYSLPKLKIKLEGLDKFLRAMGQKLPEVQKKLKIQKKDLPTKETKIVILEPNVG